MNKTKQIQTIIYLGALWGIAEATIGHLLHFLPCGFSGVIMFPIGFYFMYNAYTQTESKKAIIMTGFIAASIKLINFLLPIKSIMSVTNPAMSIVLESLVVFGFIKIFEHNKDYVHTVALGLSWVIIFTLVQAIVFRPSSGLYLYPFFQMMLFILFNGVFSGLIVGLYLKKENFLSWQPTLAKQTYVLPIIALQFALILEVVNSLII